MQMNFTIKMQIVQTTVEKAYSLLLTVINKPRCSPSTTGTNIYKVW